jgi:hypothetical protein
MIDIINMSLSIMSENPVEFLAKNLTIMTIDGIVTAGMLPLGTACYTLLYFDIINRKSNQVEN